MDRKVIIGYYSLSGILNYVLFQNLRPFHGYFKAQIKNLRLLKFFQKINFYVSGAKRTFSQYLHHRKNTNKKKTHHILRLFYGSEMQQKTTPKSEINPLA